MTRTTLGQWLDDEPFTLTMSAGFFGFYAHLGFLTALVEHGLVPAKVTGASAGALVGGLWASGREPTDLRDALMALERQDFWDPAPGLGLLRGRRMIEKLESLVATPSFEGCRVPVAISIFDVAGLTTRVVTQGRLAPAIRASCTVPGLFHPARVQGRTALDGGVMDRPGLHGVSASERVLYHHLPSRSRVRRTFRVAGACPQRPGMAAIQISGLPSVHPFALERGPTAWAAARDALGRALDRPVDVGGPPSVEPAKA